MIQKYLTLICNKFICSLLLSIINISNVSSQFLLDNGKLTNKISINSKAEYIDVGEKNLTLDAIKISNQYQFSALKNENTDFGFTTHHFWIRFKLKNITQKELLYFFETARPITDIAELYVVKQDNSIAKYISGDSIPFNKKSFKHRKTIFEIKLLPNEEQQFYLHVKSDGEMLSMPMILHSMEDLIQTTSFEQFVFGFFYGILLIAAILYLFFFFAMRDKTFLYYSFYVVFIGLLQFSVDGYFYEFITPQSGWLSLHSVLLFATLANFFLGRYAQVFLKIKSSNKLINNAFFILYIFDAILFLALIFIPKSLEFGYPIANFLGLVLLILIVASQISIYNKTKQIDRFFAIGILFLISGFISFYSKKFQHTTSNFLD